VLVALQKLNGNVAAAAAGPVTAVTGTAPIASSGGAAPAISISAATTSAAGSMSATDKTKLDGIAAGATAFTEANVRSTVLTGFTSGSGTVTATDSLLAALQKLAGNAGASSASYYNRRPPLHRGPLLFKTAATTISITAGAVLNGQLYTTATAVTMPGSFTNNTDYAIWQHPTTGALVGDASFTTAPAGAPLGSIVGGFHYIPSGRPTAFNSGSPTTAAEILEFSLWDLTWRPSCPDPRGMACIQGGFWMDLYLCGATSYAGATFLAVPSSRIGLTIGDGPSAPLVPDQFGGNGTTTYGTFTWYEASEMAASFGKRLPFYAEFAAAAYGAPEASSRGSDPGTVIWERASQFGLAQATGVMYQWGADTSGSGGGGSFSATTEGRGSVYSTDARAVLLGGYWTLGAVSGSRHASWGGTPWNSDAPIGARFAAGHLVLG